jgi:serine/threonine-protein kinase
MRALRAELRRRGDRAAADAELDGLINEFGNSMAYQIAEVYAFRGDPGSALAWLQRAYGNRDNGILGMLIDPLLRDLHAAPRFNALRLKLGLPATPR